jgi:hypothetical protein
MPLVFNAGTRLHAPALGEDARAAARVYGSMPAACEFDALCQAETMLLSPALYVIWFTNGASTV